MAEDNRRARGQAMRRKLMGEEYAKKLDANVYQDPIMQKFAEVTQECVFGSLWTREGLDLKTRSLICVISDAATGRTPELVLHLRFARNQGWTEDELAEALLHLAGYVGAPLVREAMLTATEARNLLADDGVLLISLDDTELNRLITMLEEIFGEQNFVANFIWRKKYSLSFMADEFISIHENIICVRKKDILSPVDRRWVDQTTVAVKPVFKSQNQRSTKIFRAGCKSKAGADFIIKKGIHSLPSQDLEFLDSATFVDGVLKDDVRVVGNFAVGQDTLDTRFGEIEVSPSGAAYFNSDSTESSIAPLSILFDYTKDEKDELYEAYRHRKSISTRQATSEVEDLLGRKVFDNPKPVALIRYLVETLIPDLEAVVLDFFAGSGTTGQAVMEQNALDGGNRQFIMVQLPEPLLEENKEQAAALAFCKEHNLEENIAALTAERLRRAGAKVRSENPMFAGDVGFRVFKLAESNIRAWNPLTEDLEGTLRTSEDHLVKGRSALDVLYEILLKRGLDLCIPIETKEISGHHVNAVGGGVLFACLDSQIAQTDVETLAEGIVAWREELGVVGDVNCIFRDSAFDNDVAKSNMSSILEQAGFTKIQSL